MPFFNDVEQQTSVTSAPVLFSTDTNFVFSPRPVPSDVKLDPPMVYLVRYAPCTAAPTRRVSW